MYKEYFEPVEDNYSQLVGGLQENMWEQKSGIITKDTEPL